MLPCQADRNSLRNCDGSVQGYDDESEWRGLGGNPSGLWWDHFCFSSKVLARSFKCENRACFGGNPCESFSDFAKCTFFIREKTARDAQYESLSLYDIVYFSLFRAITSCLPWVRQENGTGRTFTFRFVGSSQASEYEVSPQPDTMVLKHIVAPARGAA